MINMAPNFQRNFSTKTPFNIPSFGLNAGSNLAGAQTFTEKFGQKQDTYKHCRVVRSILLAFEAGDGGSNPLDAITAQVKELVRPPNKYSGD